MSYCRFGWDGSDVYVFLDYRGCLTCCGCIFQNVEFIPEEERKDEWAFLRIVEPFVKTDFETTAEMVAHLEEHILAGHTVPAYVIPDLWKAQAEDEAYIAERRKEKSD